MQTINPYSIKTSQMLIQMFTGMRMGEINALTKDDINLTFNTISVNKTVSRGKKGKAKLSETTKTLAGTRIIYFGDDIKPLLEECVKYAENDLLFPNKNGDYLTTNQVNMELQRVFEKYDIIDKTVKGNLTSHSLRHTYATRMIESGMQPKVLSKLLGHNDIKVTLNTYCDAFEQFPSENIRQGESYLREKGLNLGNKKDGSDAVKDIVEIG